MTTLSEIQSEIVSLGTSDYKALRRWFAERDWEAWDREFEEDAKSGGLDFLAEEARIAAPEGRPPRPVACIGRRVPLRSDGRDVVVDIGLRPRTEHLQHGAFPLRQHRQ